MISLRPLLFGGVGLFLISFRTVTAGDLTVAVVDGTAEALDRAVVTLMPQSGPSIESLPTVGAVMRQQGTMFHPFVLPVKTGTSVSFPNLDEFRHHVYSFSKAKRLELRLYGKDETNEIVFDQAGVVALGCNIHDNMLAYIFVTDDPFYTVSDSNGFANFEGLTPGKYQVTVWHPDQKSKNDLVSQDITVEEASKKITLAVEMRSVRRRQKGPDGKEY